MICILGEGVCATMCIQAGLGFTCLCPIFPQNSYSQRSYL